MAERVGIVAVAQTKYRPNREDAHEGELAYEAIKQVLDETGLKYGEGDDQISSAVTCSQDFWDGRTISNLNVNPHVGAHHSHEDKVAEDGINAVYTAMAQVLSGQHAIIIVVSHMKESMGSRTMIENAALDPIYLRILGLDFMSAAALQARRYMHKYGITPEQCAQVVVKNRGNAFKNPCAQEPLELSVDDVLGSRLLSSPIRALDTKPVSDGACAMIVAREDKAKKLTSKPVWILGALNCYETHYLGDRDLAECDALTQAAKKSFKMAGIKDPARKVDLVELSEEYSYQELMWLEGMGFCGRGEAGKMIESGMTQLGGKLPVNPSGGMLAGNPNGVAGMTRVVECALQLRNEAGEHQVDKAKIAVAHGSTGACGQLQGVIVLGK